MEEILKIAGDSELMQSFILTNVENVEDETSPLPAKESSKTPASVVSSITADSKTANVAKPTQTKDEKKGSKTEKKVNFSQVTRSLNLGGRRGRRRRGVKKQEEVYTDKDRAAAVVMGSKDIKQSLKLKQKKDRTITMQIPEEADCEGFLALGSRAFRLGDIEGALLFVEKALELSPGDKHALVARSRCYLLLGKPEEALQDAEEALKAEPGFIKGILQKAEALYHLGDFEHSLVYFHRGLRARPECKSFRLGVQKAQEAIENTIGVKHILWPSFSDDEEEEKEKKIGTKIETNTRACSKKSLRKTSNHLDNGPLSKDKQYLEQLLKNPDLRSEDASRCAQGAIEFVNIRQRFWQQQSSARRIK